MDVDRTLLLWCLAVCMVSGRDTWYLVDAPLVVCSGATPPAPGKVSIQLPLDSLSGSMQNNHAMTFYRTSPKALHLAYEVTDARGQVVVARRKTDLAALTVVKSASPRRLLEDDLRLRRLGARRRMGGLRSHGGSHGLSHSSTGMRRRSPIGSGTPRRRSQIGRPAQGQNSGHAQPQGQHFPATYSNSHMFGGQHYSSAYQGYPHAMGQNFPGGYHKYGYGYSGMNAYTPSSSGSIMMAMAGGALAGYAGSYMYSRWNTYSYCEYGSSWRGSCYSCYQAYSRESCHLGRPQVNAHRDDLFSTQFRPSDFTGPLTITISEISGEDFSSSKLCPQNSIANQTWQPAAAADLFLTLTELAGPGSQDLQNSSFKADSGQAWAMPFMVLLCCCGCVGLAILQKFQKDPAKDKYDEVSGSYLHGSAPVATELGPVTMGQPVSETVMEHNWNSKIQQRSKSGFMVHLTPNGMTWRKYCEASPVTLDHSGALTGAWAECVAYAKAYELQNPHWEHDPQFSQDGPCGQVIAAMESAGASQPALLAAERLEEACEVAAVSGQPLPVINRLIAVE